MTPEAVRRSEGDPRSHIYSLWLIPQGDEYKRLSRLISNLAKSYNAPQFDPHVTLLGGIQLGRTRVIEQVEQLTYGQEPMSIILGNIGHENHFFRTLFLYAEKSPQLLELNHRSRVVFNKSDEPSYMPHLSLLYGNFSQDTKDGIITDLGTRVQLEFHIDRVHIFQTEGEVNTWKKVEEIPFR